MQPNLSAPIWSLTYYIDSAVFSDERRRKTVMKNIQSAYSAMNRSAFCYQAKQPNCNQASVRRFLGICLRGVGGFQLFSGSSQYVGLCLSDTFPEEQLKEVAKFLETAQLGSAMILLHNEDYPMVFKQGFLNDLIYRVDQLAKMKETALSCKTSPQRREKAIQRQALYTSMMEAMDRVGFSTKEWEAVGGYDQREGLREVLTSDLLAVGAK